MLRGFPSPPEIIASAVTFIIAIALHEFMHAWTAYRLGDVDAGGVRPDGALVGWPARAHADDAVLLAKRGRIRFCSAAINAYDVAHSALQRTFRAHHSHFMSGVIQSPRTLPESLAQRPARQPLRTPTLPLTMAPGAGAAADIRGCHRAR